MATVIALLRKGHATVARAGCMATAVIVLATALLAQPATATEAHWQSLDDTLARGERHGHFWQFGWGAFHGVNLGRNIYLASEGSNSATRFDARVDTVKSLLAVGALWLEPPPYSDARQRLQELRASGAPDSIHRAEQLIAETARVEAQRRRPRALVGALAVNLVAGATIAVGDNRTTDGLRNAALGMTVSAIQVWSQPATLQGASLTADSAAVIPGGEPIRFRSRIVIAPSYAAVRVRWY